MNIVQQGDASSKRPTWVSCGSKSYRFFRSFLRLATSNRYIPRPKIFFIGFNKCGTKTFHNFFQRNGYLSVHSRTWWAKHTHGKTAAQIMEANQAQNLPILRGLSRYEVFSDLIYVSDSEIIEANKFFREMHRDYPDAYFVFNDRPVDRWIRSRVNHEGGKHGSFIAKFENALGLSRDGVIEGWRANYENHKSDVLDYFHNQPRFLIYNIETDEPRKLLSFFARDFKLDISKWEHRGSNMERVLKQQAKKTG